MRLDLVELATDWTSRPRFSRGSLAVWRRDYRYFRRTWPTSVFWVCFEPLLFLLAVGYGVGSLVQEVDHVTYSQFFFPGLLATSSMTISFFEATYGTFSKLKYQKTFQTTLLSPISTDDIVIGEVLWAASKGLLSVLAIAFVGLFFGLSSNWLVLPAIVILAINCWLFAALGLLVCTFARGYDSFIYVTSGFIVPMSLFSGTYFPLSQLPEPAQGLVYIFPLTSCVSATRDLILHRWSTSDLIFPLFLLVFAIVMTNWACARVRRLIER